MNTDNKALTVEEAAIHTMNDNYQGSCADTKEGIEGFSAGAAWQKEQDAECIRHLEEAMEALIDSAKYSKYYDLDAQLRADVISAEHVLNSKKY